MPVAKHRKKKTVSAAALERRRIKPCRAIFGPPIWSAAEVLSSLQAGQADVALARAGERLVLQPNDVEALHIAGVAATRLEQFTDAIRYLQTAHELCPEDPAILINLGRAKSQAGDLQAARESYRMAVRLDPSNANAFFNLGNVFSRQEAFYAAIEAYESALRLSEIKRADLYNNYGYALASLSRHTEAVAAYRQAIAIDPQFADAHNNLGVSQMFVGSVLPALKSFEQSRTFGGRAADEYVNRAGSLFELDQLDEALLSTERALAIDQADAEAWRLRGVCLAAKCEDHLALEALDRAVALDLFSGDAQFSRGIHRLRLGDLKGGWHDYEARWISSFLRRARRNFVQPPWDGQSSLNGRTVLLHAEQGLGDTLQFVRFAGRLKALGATVLLEAQPALVSLLTRSVTCVDRVLARGEPLPAFDVHIPLMSCPHLLGIELHSIPAEVPYLSVDEGRAVRWQRRLGNSPAGLVGLVCSGSRTHREDRHRSLPLEKLLSALPLGPRYVVLQTDLRSDDRRALANRPDVLSFAEQLTDFDETAALCSLMDAVVSVDTSVAHLAGALDRPVHLLLPFNSDFRWLRHRSDSPWYPSMRLYRQPAMGRWTEPLAEMGASLLAEMKKTLADYLIEHADCEV